LNPRETEDAIVLIQKIRDAGVTIIIVEHVMKVIMGISDRVLAINFGREITTGTPREVANHPEVIKAYLGETYATS
jgi:branched-chain amino acid transport system ATP-binding protein